MAYRRIMFECVGCPCDWFIAREREREYTSNTNVYNLQVWIKLKSLLDCIASVFMCCLWELA